MRNAPKCALFANKTTARDRKFRVGFTVFDSRCVDAARKAMFDARSEADEENHEEHVLDEGATDMIPMAEDCDSPGGDQNTH